MFKIPVPYTEKCLTKATKVVNFQSLKDNLQDGLLKVIFPTLKNKTYISLKNPTYLLTP